jgi:dolichol-phosphate mannosyltransferase
MARRRRPRGFSIQRTQSWLFYRVFSYLTDIPYDGTVSNFSIIHRKVLDTINEMGEAIRYYPGLLFWAGFPTGFIDAQHDPRFEGETTYTWSRLLAHAQSIILAHSSKPLMLCVKAGFFVVLLALLGALYLVVRAVVLGSAVMGWPSLMVTILFSTGAIIFTLGIVGLYVGRIFAEVRRRPLFVVRKTTYDE